MLHYLFLTYLAKIHLKLLSSFSYCLLLTHYKLALNFHFEENESPHYNHSIKSKTQNSPN